MARERKDRSANWFMMHHGGSLLRLAKISNVVRWQAVQSVLTFPKQIPDGLLDVTFADKSEPDPFLVEIETYPDKDTVEQVLKDLAMVLLVRGVIPDIIVVVLRPKGNFSISPEQIGESAHGLTELRFKIHVINLWTVPAEELLAAKDVGLIPWVPLSQFGGPPEILLRQCRERIEQQASNRERDNLLAATRVMAEAKYNSPQLLSLLGGEIMTLDKIYLESPTIQRLVERKAQEAAREIAEGMAHEMAQKMAQDAALETERRTVRKNILRLLQKRFGAPTKKVSALLDAVDDQLKLEELLDLALLCRDLKEFREKAAQ